MASAGMTRDEGIGLAIAVALHAAVLGAMLIRPSQDGAVKPPQRIEVTISDDVAMTSTSPDPFSDAAPDTGPELGEAAPPPAAEPEVAPAAAPVPAPAPEPPQPRPSAKPEPKPTAKPSPAPKPSPKPKAKPKAKPSPKPEAKPVQKPKPAPKAPPKPASSRKTSAIDDIVSQPKKSTASPKSSSSKSSASSSANTSANTPRKAGSSAFADAFGAGQPGAKSSSGAGAPAAEIGPQQRSALGAAINRQLKPHWQAPQGADADLLTTRVRFRLNRDGSLAGEPQVLSTSGKTAANQAQVQRHQEQAIRAVKLASPFNLPDDLYEGWKVVTTNFDRRLSQ
jgi:Predicted membrane protein